MPKAKTSKFYAVLIGRNGPQIYTNWEEASPSFYLQHSYLQGYVSQCKDKVSRFPGAVHKSFRSRKEAEDWLGTQPKANASAPGSGPQTPIVISDDEDGPSQPSINPTSIIVLGDDDNLKLPSAPKNPPVNTVTAEQAALDSTAPKPKTAIVLSPEQQTVLNAVRAGKNVFFTGSAGTGKSVLLREIIDHCGGRDAETLAITATTGIAAVNIGGCTLHSWAGIGLGHEAAKNFIGKCLGNEKFHPIVKRWQHTRTLIIDEISMLDGNLFDKLEAIGRGLRRSELPFGGIQLVLCGDFCQLPPISGKDSKGVEIPAQFAFDAARWTDCVGRPMMLSKVFRQKDQRFVDMLNEMRFGELQPETIRAFQSLSRKVQYTDGIEPTELYSMRHEVQYANSSRLNQLSGKEETFTAHDMSGVDNDGNYVSDKRRNQLLEKLVCQQRITLKVGAQVMLIKNLVQGQLVNGSIGKVTRFGTLSELAQDETLAKIGEKDGVFRPDSTRSSLPARAWPVVKFINGDERVITPVDFEINNAEGKMEARRVQVPLILAWALSVHKSQGQTLERVKVDLRRTFEKGQAYVAISRATTLEHLQILHFEPTKVMTHPRVLEWYGHSSMLNDDGFEDEMDCEDAIRYYHDF